MEIVTVEDILELYHFIPNKMFHNCMFFLMKGDIQPRWEDPQNRRGGCFSYKINHVNTISIWKKLTYLLLGCTIAKDIYYSKINGLTLSPKKSFHICKIWMTDCSLQDPNIFNIDIDNTIKKGCIFKRHKGGKPVYYFLYLQISYINNYIFLSHFISLEY